jgi:hypothetical protein
MLTTTLKVTAFTALSLTAALTTADLRADEYRYRPWTDPDVSRHTVIVARTTLPPHRASRPVIKHHAAKQTITLSHKFRGEVRNEELPLRRLLGITAKYRGYRIDEVRVFARHHNSRGRIKLLINGETVARERLGRATVTYLVPGSRAVVGRNAGSVKLRVRGRAFIRRIQVTLTKPAPRHVRAPRHDHKPAPVVVTKKSDDRVWRIFNRILREVAAAQ